MPSPILDAYGRKTFPGAAERRIRERQSVRQMGINAIYDAAQTTTDNSNHWANSDGLSARAAASPQVRKKLRDRSRYEVANNCYASGIVQTLCHHTIGTGPRLQLTSEDTEANRFVELEFRQWCKAVRLAEQLRTMRHAKAVDGEAFILRVTNRRLPTPVMLDLRLVEAEQVTAPFDRLTQDVNYVDGITLDDDGNPLSYDVFHGHPGDTGYSREWTEYSAEDVIHLFRPDRPGQARGLPELMPALPLFAQLRRYVLAVLTAAETAADIAGVMYTDSPNIGADEIPNLAIDDPMPIDRGVYQIMPNGWRLEQLKAEQPTTTFAEFRRAILNEAARCVSMPYNIAAADSSSYNYSSGRLDHQTYFTAIGVDRSSIETNAIDRIFRWWFDEAALIEGYLPGSLFPFRRSWTTWQWDGTGHVDPSKEANGQQTRLANGTTSRAAEYAREGVDVDEADEKAAASYGVTVEEYRKRLFDSHFGAAASTGAGSPAQEAHAMARLADAVAERLMEAS